MRKRTEEKREAILDAATAVFRDMGFHNASMNAIANRLGGSKMTLYNYFPSKEAIFLEVVRRVSMDKNETVSSFLEEEVIMDDSRQKVAEAFQELERPDDDIEGILKRFGEKFIAFLYSPKILAVRRALLAESYRPDVGRYFYEHGPRKTTELITVFLEKAMEKGQLRSDMDAYVAATHLRSLLNARWYERCLFELVKAPSDEEMQKSVADAVRVFLAAYGVNAGKRG